jgi:periodic tryptophan protein 2
LFATGACSAKCIRFSPTGRAFSVATTEGLVTYSLDTSVSFDPFELDIDITPENILNVVLPQKQYLKALVV